ncbi:MAG: hypothetical protein WAN65_01155 [Candidatus Sulfotelmatobacter sp.]
MLHVYAQKYVDIGGLFSEYAKRPDWILKSREVMPEDEFIGHLQVIDKLKEYFEQAQLTVSLVALEDATANLRKNRPTYEEFKGRIGEIKVCFKSELASQLFMLVLPHRKPYWSSGDKGGREIQRLIFALADSFPDSIFDACEAGRCFSYELFTACVYHLMRVAESALVSVARGLNVSEHQVARGWDGCIQGIQGAIKVLESQPNKPINWKDTANKYNSLCSWFTTVSKGWRNPSSHAPRIYSEATASAMFSAITILSEEMSLMGFKAVPMAMPLAPPSTQDSGEDVCSRL